MHKWKQIPKFLNETRNFTFHFRMKKIIFISILFISCIRQSKEDEIERKHKLLKQEYPNKIIPLQNLSPEVLNSNIREFYETSNKYLQENNAKKIDGFNIRGNDTSTVLTLYDKYGNIYFTNNHFIKYIFNKDGYLIHEINIDLNLKATDTTVYLYKNNLVYKSYETNQENYDTLTYFYNSKNQLIKRIKSSKSYKNKRTGKNDTIYANEIFNYNYDSNGNLIEWFIKYDSNIRISLCGLTTTHWTGKYDKDGFLVSSQSDGFGNFQDYTKPDSTININKTYYKNGKIKTFRVIGINNPDFKMTCNFQYY